MRPQEEAIEAAISGLEFLVPFTAGSPIQAFGTLGTERFEFAWKRHTAWLAVGQPAQEQPFASDDLPLWLEDLLRPLGADVVEEIRESHRSEQNPYKAWIIVAPSKYMALQTAAEDAARVVEVFLKLYNDLQDVTH